MQKNQRWTVMLVLGWFLGCGSLILPVAHAQKAPEEIKIGCTVPLSGRLAQSGVDVQWGYEAAVADVNKEGGLFMKEFNKKLPVKLFMYDDESDPTKAATRYERLVMEDKVDVLLGSYSTMINTAVVVVAEKHKIPIVANHFSHELPHRQGYKYLFSPFVKSNEYANGIDYVVEMAALKKVEKPKTAAIVMNNTEIPKEVAAYYRKRCAELGIEVVVNEVYALGRSDFSPIIMKTKSSKAEIWLSLPTPPEGLAMLRQMKELDYNPKIIFMTQANTARGWPGDKGQLGEFTVSLESWGVGLPFPGNKELVDTYTAKMNHKPGPNIGTGYQAVQVAADAVRRAGTLDKTRIRDSLAATDMMTISGPVKFKPDGMPIMENFLFQWINGAHVAIWPKKYPTITDPVYPQPEWNKR